MTVNTHNFDEANERGRRAILAAEAALRERSMADPQYAARQPNEKELAELAAMDAAEQSAREAIAEAVLEVERLGRITPADAVEDRPRFDLSGILLPNRDPGNWAAGRALEEQRATAKSAWKRAAVRVQDLREDEADLRTSNNARRHAISNAGTRRAMAVRPAGRR